MENKMINVPENCSKCGKLFDLKYDLYEREEGSIYQDFDQTLCWSCRKNPVHENFDSDSMIELELELELEDI